MAGYIFESKWTIGDAVHIDNCTNLTAHVTAVLWRTENPLVEVSWIDGSSRTAWVEQWRLSKAEKKDG